MNLKSDSSIVPEQQCVQYIMEQTVPVLKSDYAPDIRTSMTTSQQLNSVLLHHGTKNPCAVNGIIFDSHAARMDHRVY